MKIQLIQQIKNVYYVIKLCLIVQNAQVPHNVRYVLIKLTYLQARLHVK